MSKQTGAEALVERLCLHGVDLLFGIISIHNLDLFDALFRAHGKLRHIGGRTELACGFMADGYARSSGRPGILLTSTGPGAANSMHSVGEAYHSSSPLLHLTTAIPRKLKGRGLGQTHEPRDQLQMFQSVSGHVKHVCRPESLLPIVDEAFVRLRTHRRRPAVIEIPTDLLGEPCEVEDNPLPAVKTLGANQQQLDRILEAIRHSRRPLIWAGEEINYTLNNKILASLAELLGAPVVTADGAKDVFPEDHPLSLGTCLGQRIWGRNPIHEFIPRCDLVLALGAGLLHRSTVEIGLQFPSQLVQVVLDRDYLGRNYPISTGIVADAGVVMQQLLKELRSEFVAVEHGYQAEIQQLRERIRRDLEEQWPTEMRVLNVIRSVLPRETITCWDTTVPTSRASRSFEVYQPRTFINPFGWVGIGFSFPAALGAKAANPKTPVVCFSGDGGFQYCLSELATAVQYKLNVTIVLFNDNAWGVLKEMQKVGYGGRYLGTNLLNPDFQKIAGAYGIAAVRVNSLAQLLPVLEKAISSDETNLIEVIIPEGFSRFH